MNRLFTIACIIVFASPGLVSFQSNFDTNAKIKSMFVYNFTKYIEWPQDYKTGNFTIGILGESAMASHLDQLAKTKKAGLQPIEIKKYSSPGEIGRCHMLVLPRDNASKLAECNSRLEGFSTLVITEDEGLAAKGSGINFVVRDNRQKFELNKKKVEGNHLKVSSSLLSLAIIVE